ncbi:LysR family transcriptional regulator [Paenibacillus sp. DCT19]|uniref:LysR family transcriptional regulator n=1 Tax=Paenibacillus sp. DCT19 TaxID=2211212 RepID=UPI000FE233C8|nr:LysR family transcriptional regulator [Paenibacillus sp. DCT19]
MRLEQLKYIIEVANCGSITVAADKLHVSQPNISYAISSLEKELDAVIFHRTRAGTETTEIGRSIIEQAQEIMNQVEILKNTSRNHGSLVEGTLTIGAISGICTSFLPKTLSAVKTKYPNVDLVIHEGHSGEIEEGVIQGKLDIGLVGIPGDYEFKNLHAHPFMVCKILACVGASSPLASKDKVSFHDIVQYPVVASSEHMRKELKRYGTPKELFLSNRTEAAKLVIAEGIATCFYLDVSLKTDPYVKTGQIIPIPVKEDPEVQLFWLHSRKKQTVASEAFIQEFLNQVNQFNRLKFF